MEATRPARMALSAMVRTGGRFGAAHLIDILIGNETDQVRDNGHHLLHTFGVGRDFDRQFWRDLLNALVGRGLAENSGGTSALAAAPRSRPLLRGEDSFFLLRALMRERVRRRAKTDGLVEEASAGGLSEELLKRLKTRRQELARAAHLPPYVIFSDRSLREMAQLKPTEPESFLAVSGVGQHKLVKYGRAFMDMVAEYLEEFPSERPSAVFRPEPERESRPGPGPSVRPEKGPGTVAVTGQLLREGLSLEEAAERRGLTVNTVTGHLEQLVQAGAEFDSTPLIDPERLAEIVKIFERREAVDGEWYLRPVVEESGGLISYQEARLARLFGRAPKPSR